MALGLILCFCYILNRHNLIVIDIQVSRTSMGDSLGAYMPTL